MAVASEASNNAVHGVIDGHDGWSRVNRSMPVAQPAQSSAATPSTNTKPACAHRVIAVPEPTSETGSFIDRPLRSSAALSAIGHCEFQWLLKQPMPLCHGWLDRDDIDCCALMSRGTTVSDRDTKCVRS
jgi:hypothetical protein